MTVLPGLSIGPGLLGGGDAGAQIEYVTGASNTSSGSSYQFNSVNFGAPAPDRRIFLIAGARTTNAISETRIANEVTANNWANGNLNESLRIHAASTLLPTGTSGTINIQIGGTASGCVIAIFRAVGLKSPAREAADRAVTPMNMSLRLAKGGVLIGGCFITGSSNPNVSGLEIDNGRNVGGARLVVGSMSNTMQSSEYNVEFSGVGVSLAMSWG